MCGVPEVSPGRTEIRPVIHIVCGIQAQVALRSPGMYMRFESDLIHGTRKVCVFVVDPVILMPNPSLCDPVGPMRIVHQERVRRPVP